MNYGILDNGLKGQFARSIMRAEIQVEFANIRLGIAASTLSRDLVSGDRYALAWSQDLVAQRLRERAEALGHLYALQAARNL